MSRQVNKVIPDQCSEYQLQKAHLIILDDMLEITANEEFIALTDIDPFKINCGVQSSSEQDVVSMETHLMFVTFCGNENPTKT